MKKRIIILFLLIIFSVSLTAYLFLKSPVVEEKFKKVIVTYLEKETGGKVEIDNIFLSLIPAEIELRNFRLKKRGDDELLFSSPKITAKLGLSQIFARKVIIKKLFVTSPDLNYPLEDETFKKFIIFLITPPDLPFDLELKQFQTAGANLNFYSNKLKFSGKINSFALEYYPKFLFKNEFYKLNATSGELKYHDLKENINKLSVEATFAKDKYLIEKFEFETSGGTTATLKGAVLKKKKEYLLSLDSNLNFNLKLAAFIMPDLSNINGKAAASLHLEGSIKEPKIDGKLSVSEGSYKNRAFSGLSSVFSYEKGEIKIADFSANIFKGNVKGDGVLSLGNVLIYRANLLARDLHLDQFSKVKGTLSGEARIRGDSKKNGSGDVDFTFKGVSYQIDKTRGISFDTLGIASKVLFSPDGYEIANAAIKSNFLNGMGNVKGKDLKNWNLSADLKVSNLDFLKLTDPVVRGRGSFSLAVSSKDDTLSGKGIAFLEEGRLNNFTYKTIKGELVLNPGLIELSNLSISSAGTTIEGNGLIKGNNYSLKAKIVKGEIADILNIFNRKERIKGQASGEIQFAKEGGDLSGNIMLNASGLSIYDEPFEGGKIEGYLKEGTLNVKNLNLAKSGGVITVKGLYYLKNEEMDFKLTSTRVDISGIKSANVPLKGYLDLSGTLKGTAVNPDFEGRLSVSGTSVKGIKIGNSQINTTFKNSNLAATGVISDGKLKFTVNVKNSQNLPAKFSANLNDIEILPFSEIAFNTRIGGTASGKLEWDGEILSYKNFDLVKAFENSKYFKGNFTLKDAYYKDVRLGVSSFDASLNQKSKEMDFSASIFDKQGMLKGKIALKESFAYRCNMEVNSSNIAKYIEITKKKNVTVAFGGSGELKGNLKNISTPAGFFRLNQLHIKKDDYFIKNNSPLDVNFSGRAIRLSKGVLSGPGTNLVFSGGINDNNKIDFNANGNINLKIFELFAPYMDRTGGDGLLTLKAQGTVKNPDMSGTLAIKKGYMDISGFPHTFENLEAECFFTSDKIAVENISGTVAGGSVKGNGTVRISDFSLKKLTSYIVVKNANLKIVRWLSGTASGEISFTGDGNSILLSGEADVKKAYYVKKSDLKSFIIKRKYEPTYLAGQKGLLNYNLRFKANKNVYVDTSFAKGELKGELLLTGNINKPVVLGTLQVVNGDFSFKDHVFKITGGSIEFQDSRKINPSFDITSETKIKSAGKERKIFLSLSGTFDKYNAALSSDDPFLSEKDIVTLLAFGVTDSELLQKGGASLSAAGASGFATIPVKKALESQLNKFFGFEKIGIESGYSKATKSVEPRLTVQKEVAPDLNITYYTGLSATAEQGASLEFKVTNNTFLVADWRSDQARGGTAGTVGALVKFRFEFKEIFKTGNNK